MNVLSKYFSFNSIALDLRLMKSLDLSVDTAMNGSTISLTQLGRDSALARNTTDKYGIKRSDRLLGNKKLQAKRLEFYKSICHQFINIENPVILVDWSSVYNYNFVMIRASLPIQGRAITIYEEVHPLSRHTNGQVHKSFLAQLGRLLPQGCKPIICTDAGFKVPWCKDVEQQGWYWLTRVRGTVKCKTIKGNDWVCAKELHQQATSRAKELGTMLLSKAQGHLCRFLLIKQKLKGRKNLNREGQVTKCSSNKRHSKAAREPWLLSTNLPKDIWKKTDIINIYHRRMTIEETFRDNKNEHYGLGLSRNRSRSTERIEILLLIATLAQIALYIIGKAAESLGLQKHFQANTEKKRKVLSKGYLALRLLKSQFKRLITKAEIDIAIEQIAEEIPM